MSQELALVAPEPADDEPLRPPPLFVQRPELRGQFGKLYYMPAREELVEVQSGHATQTTKVERVQYPARWRLEGSPAVVMLARRIFDEAISRSPTKVSWPAHQAIFEDLLMIQHRYPVTLSQSAKGPWEAQYQATLAKWQTANSSHALISQGLSRFKGKLLEFQQESLRHMLVNRRSLNGDDMGLGKTPVSIAWLDTINAFPAVIVCQSHVQRHWQKKLPEFLDVEPATNPLLNTGKLTWTTLTGTRVPPNQQEADIYIVHYLVLHAWAEWLAARGVKAVVFDEAQELRHRNTRKHDACMAIAGQIDHVAGLSGTPIYNRGPEIYNVLDSLNRGCLGSFAQFTRDWCAYDTDKKLIVENPADLGSYLRDRGLMVRHLKDDVLTELPSKRKVIEPIDADNALFAQLIREAVKLAKDAENVRDPFEKARIEAAAISAARRATGRAKVPAVIPFINGLMEAEEPTLVFAHHHDVHDAIQNQLRMFNPAFITGQESTAQKTRSQERFMAGDTNLCIIALRAATGIDGLQQRARVVVFAELDWSPAIHLQGEDRAHRMGQKNSVLVYYLVTDIGTDPFVMGHLGVKESQFQGLMHDPERTAEDQAADAGAAKEHMQGILDMLRGR